MVAAVGQVDRSVVRVLVLVEAPAVAELVRFTLHHGAYVARVAPDEAAAVRLLEAWGPQLAVLDMDLADGLIARLIGEGHPQHGRLRIPVLGLTRRGDLRTKLRAFEQGVDDIMSVPFSPEELLARVLVIARRVHGLESPLLPAVRLGEIELDILQRVVRAGTSELHLTGLEQSLLYLLAANAGRVMTREEILDGLWGVDFAAESNVVDRHVRNLRAKLQNDWRKPRFIETVPGRGYRFLPTFHDRGSLADAGGAATMEADAGDTGTA
jgi:DNA-binding response OmpR family regulator